MHIGTPVSGGTHTTYVKAGNTASAGSWGVKSFTTSSTFITKVPLKVDSEIGPSWGEIKKK